MSIQERLIGRVFPLKFPSGESCDLHIFRVFPLAKTCQEKMFLLDHPRDESRTTYQTSFSAKIP